MRCVWIGTNAGPTSLLGYIVPFMLERRIHVPPTSVEGDGIEKVAAIEIGIAIGVAGGGVLIDLPREVGEDLAPSGGMVPEHLY